ncbi:pseudouridine synthase [Psychrosphaera haliotis]|uniref:Ribosomal small subunit pseudouridine synthase A n=1 Tax=Psychrosphaera haliotis TaxID=555083 RepID=A0A6N8FE08_9GAMM|nr:pseudouridine synthase [Psychrosphaera haliotis]MUH73220.1 pseudouridine synthase [Psychrosphaera haliotis]
MRLDKFVCKSTALSKSEAVELIKAGQVTVNGAIEVNETTQVHENNDLRLNGDILKARDFRYIIMHKPAGTICSNIDEAYPSLFNHLSVENPSELHIAGRLDADTTGMVLITDDGRWSFNITSPNKECSKVYRVKLSKDIALDATEKFKVGIKLQGEQNLTRPAALEVLTAREVLLTITEGKFHQVKRMFSAIGNKVISLHRESIGNVKLDVEEGQWRYLTPKEIKTLS